MGVQINTTPEWNSLAGFGLRTGGRVDIGPRRFQSGSRRDDSRALPIGMGVQSNIILLQLGFAGDQRLWIKDRGRDEGGHRSRTLPIGKPER
ncbi:hypothetical protein ACLB2K_018256 [Fragaria x ananassa]